MHPCCYLVAPPPKKKNSLNPGNGAQCLSREQTPAALEFTFLKQRAMHEVCPQRVRSCAKSAAVFSAFAGPSDVFAHSNHTCNSNSWHGDVRSRAESREPQ